MKKHLFLIVAAIFAIAGVSFAVANIHEVNAQDRQREVNLERARDAQWKELQDKMAGLTQENQYLKGQCEKGQKVITSQPTLVKQKVSLQCNLPQVK
jgi:peptidoglycan hydrolase CwlO-like protein